MKSLSKKLLTICLAMTMMIAFAIPAFAADTRAATTLESFATWNTIELPSPDVNAYVINVSRSSEVSANNQKVTLYPETGSRDQKFGIRYSGIDGRPRMYNEVGYNPSTRTGYSLNMSVSTNGCILWNDTADDYRDAEVASHTHTDEVRTVIRITLPNRNNRALTYRNNARNAQLYWDVYDGSLNQAWHYALS